MDKLLITGGAGYIGSHAVKYFLKTGHQVVVADTFERGSQRVAGAEYACVDISDREAVTQLCTQHRFDGALHFAAYCYVDESVRKPMLYYKNNTIGTLKLISTLLEQGIRKFIFSSSAAVYGETTGRLEENYPTVPCNPYGSSKLMVEEFLKRCAKEELIDYVSLRYFNAAGTDPEGEIGESHEPETHLIPNIFRAALTGKPFQLYGDDYPTPDGTCVRDFVHVWDLIEAHALAWQALQDGNESAVYNLGTEKGFSIREVMEEASRIAGREIPFTLCRRRPGDPPSLVAISDKIRRELGWNPSFGLRDMLITAYKWQKKMNDATDAIDAIDVK